MENASREFEKLTTASPPRSSAPFHFRLKTPLSRSGAVCRHQGVFCSTFDKTGTRLITGGADKTIKVRRGAMGAARIFDGDDLWKIDSDGILSPSSLFGFCFASLADLRRAAVMSARARMRRQNEEAQGGTGVARGGGTVSPRTIRSCRVRSGCYGEGREMEGSTRVAVTSAAAVVSSSNYKCA